MMKRNEGYALSYVLVVLMVLCIIATAVMAPPLRNLQMQQASIERMQEKYIAQGMIEQVVAQLDGVTDIPNMQALQVNLPNNDYTCTTSIKDGTTSTYVVKASYRKTSITAEILLTKSEGAEKYSVSYISYNTEVAQ